MTKPFIAARMNFKPLLPGDLGSERDKFAALQAAQSELLKRIKRKLTVQTAFTQRARAALSRHLKVTVKPSSLVVTADHPGFEWLIRGRKRAQMKWLRKARRPIPIITKEGKLIFRNATARSMKHGPLTGPNVGTKPGWIHPGRAPTDFIERAKAEARVFLKEKFLAGFKARKRRK